MKQHKDKQKAATVVKVIWQASQDGGMTWQNTTHPGHQSLENISEKRLLRVTINLE